MLRRYNCLVCGATDCSMAYADDPWCSDTCHKQVVRNLGYLSQKNLTAPVFHYVTDVLLTSGKQLTWRNLMEKIREYRDAAHISGVFHLTAEDVLSNGEGPVDWARRIVLYSRAPWRQQVSELRKPRPEVPYRVLPEQAVRGEATQIS